MFLKKPIYNETQHDASDVCGICHIYFFSPSELSKH